MRAIFLTAVTVGALLVSGAFAPAGSLPPLKPMNLEKVNTKADEDDPFLAPDGHRLYYASNPKGTFQIMVSTRARTTLAWPAGKSVEELNRDPEADQRSPFLTRDGKFYFATNADPMIPDVKFEKNFDLYFARKLRARDPFTMPTPVHSTATVADELHPWVAVNGKEFFFSRKTSDGWRVFVAKGPALGAISEPKALDLPVGFHHATLSPTGLTMYLQGPLENGRWGLFRTTRSRVGAAWAKPVELNRLNDPDGPRGDLSPSLSADGKRLYFASDRPGTKGGLDLWVIPVAQLAVKN
jgi:hypothetical protein